MRVRVLSAALARSVPCARAFYPLHITFCPLRACAFRCARALYPLHITFYPLRILSPVLSLANYE